MDDTLVLFQLFVPSPVCTIMFWASLASSNAATSPSERTPLSEPVPTEERVGPTHDHKISSWAIGGPSCRPDRPAPFAPLGRSTCILLKVVVMKVRECRYTEKAHKQYVHASYQSFQLEAFISKKIASAWWFDQYSLKSPRSTNVWLAQPSILHKFLSFYCKRGTLIGVMVVK